MKLAMIGLGKMGMGMTRRLLANSHKVVAFDLSTASIAEAEQAGAIPAHTINEAVAQLDTPAIAWVMVPSGAPVNSVISELAGLLKAGDIVIDGGNSRYTESIKHAEMLAEHGIQMLDIGVSGGVWGEAFGFNLMAGGEAFAFGHIEPILNALAPEDGYMYVGPSGSGHFVKMVHNGIEYGMMQAIAEGFELMQAKEEFELDLAGVAELWSHGSVIRSWLLELTGNALTEDPGLDDLQAFVPDSGEGRWTVEESIDLRVPVPIITLALQMRFRSRQANSFGARILAAQRNQFGGHAVRKVEEE